MSRRSEQRESAVCLSHLQRVYTCLWYWRPTNDSSPPHCHGQIADTPGGPRRGSVGRASPPVSSSVTAVPTSRLEPPSGTRLATASRRGDGIAPELRTTPGAPGMAPLTVGGAADRSASRVRDTPRSNCGVSRWLAPVGVRTPSKLRTPPGWDRARSTAVLRFASSGQTRRPACFALVRALCSCGVPVVL